MRAVFVLSLISCFFIGALPAQIPASLETNQQQLITIAADYACFKYSDDTELVFTEFYYSFYRNELKFMPDSVGYYALLEISVKIIDSEGGIIDTSTWQTGSYIENLADLKIPNYVISDMISASLKPGTYNFELLLTDLNSNAAGEKVMIVEVESFSIDSLDISGIELVQMIGEPDGGVFDKSGRKIIPNTRGIYSHDNSIVYFYAEGYNLDSAWEKYSISIDIYDGSGNIYKNIPPVSNVRESESAIIINGFNVASFAPGTYMLEVGIHTGGQVAKSSKYFEVTPGRLEWELAREREELSDFPEAERITTEEEAARFKNQILYLASDEELKQYDDLPLAGKSNFARKFWAKRDPTPGTAANEYKIEHYNRFRYANEQYSTFKTSGGEANGWRTDMGRVYVMYGPPSDIENYPSSLDTKPWRRWNYDHIEGGVNFIFIDETGFGNYRLVHSTAQRELKDYDWQARLSPGSRFQGN